MIQIFLDIQVDTRDEIRSELQRYLAEEEQAMLKLNNENTHSSLTEEAFESDSRDDHDFRNVDQNDDQLESSKIFTE